MQKIMQRFSGALLACWLLCAGWTGVRVNLAANVPVVWMQAQAQAQNNGTAYNSPAYATPGKFGYALAFNGGLAQYATLPSSVFGFGASADFSVDFWFLTGAVPTTTQGVLCSATSTRSAVDFYFVFTPSGELQLVVGASQVGLKTGVTANVWHHVAWVVTGATHTNDYYYDGALVASTVIPYPANTVTNGFIAQFGNAYNANVEIDELRVSTVKRWTGAFTPPTAAYTPDSGTRALYHFENDALPSVIDSSSAGAPLASAGNLLLVGATPTAITLNAPTTGGTAPIAYVWQRATITGSAIGAYSTLVNGSGVSGAASATLADGSSTLAAGVRYAYKCTVTDSAATPVVINSYSRIAQLGLAPLTVVSIGDSTSAGVGGAYSTTTVTDASVGQPAIDNCAAVLRTVKGFRNVAAVHGAVPGTKTSDWTATYGGSAYSNTLVANGGSFSGAWVFVRLGVNDAQAGVSAATYLANMTTICSNVVASGGKVILSYPTWREPGLYAQDGLTAFSEVYTPLLLSYLPQIDSLVNNTTIFAGDKISLSMTMAAPQTYFYYIPGSSAVGQPGAIHENALGEMMMGTNDAQALLTILYPATSTATTILRPLGSSPVHKH